MNDSKGAIFAAKRILTKKMPEITPAFFLCHNVLIRSAESQHCKLFELAHDWPFRCPY